ncbi:GAF and ANTAR domain-containing protein [Saxibacter everestensis]|uniref:GAF and ANTAR domain-containing protein n=1 Tax=Saxibacter everestensis TaxID=2909229 RepID=A0ABY8QT91_9MICO|nr:GAF and ANTAR domain-containing protein [Brevibacteriaceae bacterium ZFBP1038]
MVQAQVEQSVGEKLQDLLLNSGDITAFLDGLTAFSARYVAGSTKLYCGITLERRKRTATVASSDEEARRMDEIQLGFDDGPCLQALRTHSVVSAPDLRYEQRWPEYATAVLEHGLHSILAIPLELDDIAGAALNLYARDTNGFDDRAVDDAKAYAAEMSKALRLAIRLAKLTEVAEDREAAMESRTAIDIAIGIVMGQNRCTQSEAFEILRRASSNRNIKLRILADELVASIGRSTPETVFEE